MTFFLLLAMGFQHELGYFQVVGGCYLKYFLVEDFVFLHLFGCWELLWAVAWLYCWSWDGFGSGHNFHLILLCGDEFPPFVSHLCFLSHMGVGIRWGGSRLIWLGLKLRTKLPFQLKVSFHLLDESGEGQSLVLQGLHLII